MSWYRRKCEKPHLDGRGLFDCPADVPDEAKPVGRIPFGDLAPAVLDAVGAALEDQPTHTGLQDDLDLALASHGVVLRPPRSDA